ncbi:MAG: hypothetical protein ACR2JG_03610 [Geodermatophilaceae bacterium]
MTGAHLLGAAMSTEARKIGTARVGVATMIMLDVGIPVVCGAAVLGARSDDAALAAKLGPLVADGGWAGYLSASAQVTAVAGLLGFGVVLAWQFGREFSDGTITGLFAIPVRRATIGAAKLLVYLGWAGRSRSAPACCSPWLSADSASGLVCREMTSGRSWPETMV